MSRVLDLIETPRSDQEVVIERLRELACRPRMPDPRQAPFDVPRSSGMAQTVASLIACLGFIGLTVWAYLQVVGLA